MPSGYGMENHDNIIIQFHWKGLPLIILLRQPFLNFKFLLLVGKKHLKRLQAVVFRLPISFLNGSVPPIVIICFSVVLTGGVKNPGVIVSTDKIFRLGYTNIPFFVSGLLPKQPPVKKMKDNIFQLNKISRTKLGLWYRAVS